MLIDSAELRRRREDAGLTRPMLSAATAVDLLPGLSVSYIAQMENGAKTNPTPVTVARIAKALGCEPKDLRADQPDQTPAGGRPTTSPGEATSDRTDVGADTSTAPPPAGPSTRPMMAHRLRALGLR